tara:strand:- start:6 stop:221 length:216 start_codon:yes stop_codon:yes gene_type:complete
MQQGALKDIQPEGVFFCPEGKDVRIVDWIRFIPYILLSIKDFVNLSSITRIVVPTKSYVVVNTGEVKSFHC